MSEEMEKLYEEKLRLKSPAEYWNDFSKNYRKRGFWWLMGSIFVILNSGTRSYG